MKNIINFIFIVTLFFTSSVYSQQEEGLNKLVNNGFFNDLDVEKFFIQTNKNTYFNGETIWFKIYIANEKTNEPFLGSSNIYLSLFNEKGELLKSKLYYAEKGMTFGEFSLEDSYASGNYFLQVNTNYNRNFNSNDYSKISIVNISDKTATLSSNDLNKIEESKPEDEKLTLNIHPESGHVIKNIANKIILKFNVNDKVSGDIIDVNTNKSVAKITSNKDGIATLFLFYNSSYKIEVNYNNKSYNFALPPAEHLGLTVFKNRTETNSSVTKFTVKTNKETLNTINNDYLFGVIHRNGSLKSIAPISIQADKTEYVVEVDNANLFNGLNTISVFNSENEIIVERHFYHNSPSENLYFLANERANDSLQIGIKSNSEFKNGNISISVHDTDYNIKNTNNIISQFNLNHFLNYNFNFSTVLNNNNEWEIDNYIQILSSSFNSYPYRNKTKSNLLFKNEGGISISGYLNTQIKDINEYKVLIISKENNLFLVTDFIDGKKFKFDNVFLKESSKYQIALLDKKGKISSSNFVLYKNYKDFNPKLNLEGVAGFKNITKASVIDEQNIENFEYIDYRGITELEEVLITTDKLDEEANLKNNLKSKGIPGLAFSNVYSTDDPILHSTNLAEFIEGLPGVSIVYNSDNTTSLKNERFPKTLSDFSEPLFTIAENGIPIGTDFTIYQYRLLRDFEYVLINYRSMGFGAQGAKGVITLITNDKFESNTRDDVKYFEAEIGFNPPSQRFENSLINYGTSSVENRLNCLDWFPNVTITEEKINYFNIYTKGKNKVKLIVNGFNDEGKLIHQIIEL